MAERTKKISELIEVIKHGEGMAEYKKRYDVLESAYAPFGDKTDEIVADASLEPWVVDTPISIKLERQKLQDSTNEYGVLIFGRTGMPVYSVYFISPLNMSDDRLSAAREDEVFAFVVQQIQDQRLQFKDANTLLPPEG